MRLRTVLLVLALAPLLAACRSVHPGAALFGRYVEPLDVDLRETRVACDRPASGKASIKHVEYRGVTVEWDSNAIGEIAKRNGIRRVLFADLETVSVLGVWKSYTVHVYGEAE